MADTYGILPLPKWNEDQKEYRTHIYDQYSTFNLPKTVSPDRYEFIGIMMEALCAESFRTVYPACYDVALKNKYASDANAAAMIDLIRDGAGMDLAFMFSDSFMRAAFMFRDLINNENTDLASQYKKIEKTMLKTIERNIVTASGPDHRAFRRSDRIFRARLHLPPLRDRSGLRRKSGDGRSQPLWKLRRTVCAYGKNE